MKQYLIIPIVIAGWCGCLCAGGAEAATLADSTARIAHYPQVEPQSKYPRGLRVSPQYRVLAKLADNPAAWSRVDHQTATYEAWPDYLDPDSIPSAYRNIAVHFAQVDASQRTRFRIETLGGVSIKTLNLNPSRYSEVRNSLKQGPDWLEFEVEASDLTKHILVEINDPTHSAVLNHGLMIFLNPISEKPKGKILELPSGVVSTENPAVGADHCLNIEADSPYDALYIPQDTILDGRIQIKKKGFTVAGRGIICGSFWASPKKSANWKSNYAVTEDHKVVKGLCAGSGDTTFEGIMTVHPYHFNFTDGLQNINLKAFGWRYSSDGIHGKFIRGCFTRVNDDALYSNEGAVERSSFWGMNNGGIFQLGWGGAALAPGGNCHVKACDVLRSEWTADGGDRQNNGVFSGVISGNGTMRHNIFEDIRVDGQCFRFIAYSLGNGVALQDFTFKNIWFEKATGVPLGLGKAGKPLTNSLIAKELTGFVFDNVSFGGKPANRLEDFGPTETKNLGKVTFK